MTAEPIRPPQFEPSFKLVITLEVTCRQPQYEAGSNSPLAAMEFVVLDSLLPHFAAAAAQGAAGVSAVFDCSVPHAYVKPTRAVPSAMAPTCERVKT